jgi:outer membrane protein assembly factor BamE (lipoprotein component of BamABCDE complex)
MLDKLFLIISVSLFVLALTACGSIQVGKDFDMQTLQSKIERGVSTQNQVTKWIGLPTGTGISMDTSGEALAEWTYYFASGKLSDLSDVKVKILQIRFDKQGFVRSYNWSNSDK